MNTIVITKLDLTTCGTYEIGMRNINTCPHIVMILNKCLHESLSERMSWDANIKIKSELC